MSRQLFDSIRRRYFPWYFLADIVICSLIGGLVWWMVR